MGRCHDRVNVDAPCVNGSSHGSLHPCSFWFSGTKMKKIELKDWIRA